MARRDRESVYDTDPQSDADFDLFGRDHDEPHVDHSGDHPGDAGDPGFRPRPTGRPTRAETRRAQARPGRARRRRRTFAVAGIVVAAIVAAAVYFVVLPAYHYLSPEDYDGNGSGSVVVTVRANQDASDIGTTLEKADVVASERAFTDAASDDDRSQGIQPGSYRLHKRMSGQAALNLLLDPSSKVQSDTPVPEGSNVVSIATRLARPRCTSSTPPAGGCGLGVSQAQVEKALRNVRALGLPTDYVDGTLPSSVEGFLYPATYSFDDQTTLTQALQQMVGKFTDVVRDIEFSAKAAKLNLSPYQALTIASMAQAEAKFPEDMPKVVRVILNRLAAKTALKVDATSVYAAELAGLEPKDVNFATYDSAYNTYLHTGLPPGPISNPGEDALKAAVNPDSGNEVFYVNGDAEGHLFFTASEQEFVKAQQRCYDNGWGCAAP